LPIALPGAEVNVQQAAVKSVHPSASRIRRQNENLISRFDFRARSANEVQTVDVAGVAGNQAIGVYNPAI
jgi:hypothetical protein